MSSAYSFLSGPVMEPATCVYSGNDLEWDSIYGLEEHNETFFEALKCNPPGDHSDTCSFHDACTDLRYEDEDPDGGEIVEFVMEGWRRGTWERFTEDRKVQLPKDPRDRECDCWEEGQWDSIWYSDKEFVYNPELEVYEADPKCSLLMVYNRNENTLQLVKSPVFWNRAAASPCYPGQTDSSTDGGYKTFCLPDEYLTDQHIEDRRREAEDDEDEDDE